MFLVINAKLSKEERKNCNDQKKSLLRTGVMAPAKDKIIRSTLRNRYRNFILLKDQKNKTWNDKLKEVNVENS